MKHYFSYAADGKLVGIHTHRHSGTQLGGWPEDCRLDDPNCQNPTSVWFRENIIGKDGVVGIIACNCACSPIEQNCRCASTNFACKRVVGGALVDKLEAAVLSGQTIVSNNSTLKAPPGSKLYLKMACVGVADGSVVEVMERPSVVVLETSPTLLTFTGGETNTVEVTAPAQGLTGQLAFYGLDVIPVGIFVRGWA